MEQGERWAAIIRHSATQGESLSKLRLNMYFFPVQGQPDQPPLPIPRQQMATLELLTYAGVAPKCSEHKPSYIPIT